jgi:predicted metal-dependent hydrolase
MVMITRTFEANRTGNKREGSRIATDPFNPGHAGCVGSATDHPGHYAAERIRMASKIAFDDIVVDVIHKDIRNIHLRVCPPAGAVRISVPRHMALDTIRVFVLSRLGWIRKHQQKIIEQVREAPREYLDRESHYLRGRRYLLKVVEKHAAPGVVVAHSEIVLQVRPGSDIHKRASVLNDWYRRLLREDLLPLVQEWERKIGVRASRIIIQRMKTKWGSCNTRSGNIRINLELAKKPLECLEYVVVHELVHLIEPGHNCRFKALMDQYLPRWKDIQKELDRIPAGHEELTCQES